MSNGAIEFPENIAFIPRMATYCGLLATVKEVLINGYKLDISDKFVFTDGMLEPDSLKVTIPNGYEFDKIESNQVYFKPIEVTTYNTIPKDEGVKISSKFKTQKAAKSAIAMAQISQLLPYYGGVITDEEWCDSIPKYCITRNNGNRIEQTTRYYSYSFLAFHTWEQRERFMSYSENLQLVKDYLMLS